MYTLDNFNSNILSLTNSLVVKLSDVANSINVGIATNYGVEIPRDKREWKYYLNISGKKHFSNNDVKIKVLETNQFFSLTPEVLEEFIYTKRELLLNTNFYLELIEMYPDDYAYIKGCLYPVDIDKAIEAIDGTILTYNPLFVAENEYSLIKDLESYIKDFLHRWNCRTYAITDELYVPSIVATLFASLPSKINSLRLSKIFTNEVHPFHLEHFFRSHMDLWEACKNLKPNIKFWLYKNLRYLIKHVGKESTFKIILDKIFEKSNIGVGEYSLRIPNAIIDNHTEVHKPSFVLPKPNTTNSALNNVYTLTGDKTPIESLVTRELGLTKVQNSEDNVEYDSYVIDNVNRTLELYNFDNQKTKALNLDTGRLFRRNSVELFRIVLGYWISFIKHNRYEILIEYIDGNLNNNAESNKARAEPIINFVEPNSNQTFTITPKIGLLMLLKIMLKLTGDENRKIKYLTFSNVFKEDVNLIDEIKENIYDDKYSGFFIEKIKEVYPELPETVRAPDEFGDYLRHIIKLYGFYWALDSSTENPLISANIKQIMYHMIETDRYELTDVEDGLTIDELLELEDSPYDISNNFDLELSLNSIVKTFTDITIDEYADIKELIANFTIILNKLTSYTLQSISSPDGADSLSVYYNNEGFIYSKNGLIAVMDAELTPLEPEYVGIDGHSDDFRDIIRLAPIDDTFVDFRYETSAVRGVGEVLPDIWVYDDKPRFAIDLFSDQESYHDLDSYLIVPTNTTIEVTDLCKYESITIRGTSDADSGKLIWNKDGIVREFGYLDLIISRHTVLTFEAYSETPWRSVTVLPCGGLEIGRDANDKNLIIHENVTLEITDICFYDSIRIMGTDEINTGKLLWTKDGVTREFNHDDLIITRDTFMSYREFNIKKWKSVNVFPCGSLRVGYTHHPLDLIIHPNEVVILDNPCYFNTITILGNSEDNTGKFIWERDGLVTEYTHKDIMITRPTVITQDQYDRSYLNKNITVFSCGSLTIDENITDIDLIVNEHEYVEVINICRYKTVIIKGTSDDDTGVLVVNTSEGPIEYRYDDLVITRPTIMYQEDYDNGNYRGVHIWPCGSLEITNEKILNILNVLENQTLDIVTPWDYDIINIHGTDDSNTGRLRWRKDNETIIFTYKDLLVTYDRTMTYDEYNNKRYRGTYIVGPGALILK